jgi:hypothetical protein
MANKNFVVQNGLTVGALTIDAATGDISTPGNVTISGSVGVSSITKNDSSIAINDSGSSSTITITLDGTLETTIDAAGVKLPSGDAYYINGTSVLNATTLGTGVTASSLTSVGTLTGLTLSGTLTGTTINAATIGNTGATLTGNVATFGNVVTTAGLVSSGSYSGAFTDGTVMDYTSPYGQFTVGTADGIKFRNGGISSPTTLITIDSSGNLLAGSNASATLGNSTLWWSSIYAANYYGTIATAAQPSITSLGTLTGLTLSGTLTGTTVNAATIGNSGATLTGTLSTAAQPNVTSLGTLTGLTTGGITSTGVVNVTNTTNSTGAGSGAVTISGGLGVAKDVFVAGNITANGSLSFTGNATITNITGNSGTFYGNTPGFGALYAGISSGYTQTPDTVFQAAGNYNGYIQNEFQNINSGGSATADWVATSNAGTDSTYYVDLGIAGSGYNNLSPSNSLGTSLYPNDAYLYAQGSSGLAGGNLVVGTSIPGTSVRFIAGGINTANVVATIAGTGVTLTQTLTGTTINASTIGNTGAAIVAATVSAATIGNASAALTGATLNTSGTATVNALTSNGAVSGTTGTFSSTGSFTGAVTLPSITKSGTNGSGDIGQSNNTFATVYATTFSGVSTTAKYADLAENYSADADYAPGTVLHFGGDSEVTQCNEDMCQRVAGVVTTNPAHLMNSELQGTKAAIALQGRVPCRVVGVVRKGDMMVSAGNGAARAEANPKIGSVIGKALENFDGSEGVIEVVVGRV